LLPLALLLVRLGLTTPPHVLSDEKFARLDGKRIYLFMVSQGELIILNTLVQTTHFSGRLKLLIPLR
jgi:hypothetical protein